MWVAFFSYLVMQVGSSGPTRAADGGHNSPFLHPIPGFYTETFQVGIET